MSHCRSFNLELPPEPDAKVWTQYSNVLRSIAWSLGDEQTEQGEKITDIRAWQSSLAWKIGDWINAGKRLGIKPKKLKQQLDLILERAPKKYTSRVLDTMAYTADAFEITRRRAEISIWFHCEIAKRRFPRGLEDKALKDAAGDIPNRPDLGPMSMAELKKYLDHTAEIMLHQERPAKQRKLTVYTDEKSYGLLESIGKRLWGRPLAAKALMWLCEQYLQEHGTEFGIKMREPAASTEEALSESSLATK